MYPLLTATVVPRPIVWVSTLSADVVGNLAPHSFYTVACARPPIVQFTSVTEKEDTLRNVRETGQFVINAASAPYLDEVNASSARYEEHVDEADALDVAMDRAARSVPRVVHWPASIECRLHSAGPRAGGP